MKDLSHYILLAEMFRYPSEKLKDYPDGWRMIIRKYDCQLLSLLDPFADHVANRPLEYQQEYFVSTFDVQPLCCLDIGYTLFGEDYRRGHFMANLKAEHRKAGNNCGTELPDSLPVIMTLLPKLKDEYFAEELVFSLVAPAIHEIIAGFRSDGNYYKGLLRIIAAIMDRDYPKSEFERFIFPEKQGNKKQEKVRSE
jgi:nitrate reductase assembly molybdenum cofactor insertion protein NarJ